MTESETADLWARVGALFAEPDSDLLEITVAELEPATLARLAGHLHERASELAGAFRYDFAASTVEPPEVPVLLGTLAAAAAEVAAGERDAFHVLLRGVRAGGAALPDLGCFVFEDELALDYCPGADWAPAAIAGLFSLLRELRALAPGAEVLPYRHALPHWQRTFSEAVAQYCDPAAAG